MDLLEKVTIRRYHRHRIETFREGTVEALGWRGEESQARRFEVLASVGDLNGCSVLDVGCGHGDLKGYLTRACSGVTYIGIDQMPEFINVATERYRDPNTYFFQSDFTVTAFPRVDYVFASGALSYRCASARFYFDMIRKMYDAATRAVAFNMLDAGRFPNHPLLVGHHPAEIVAFCQELSPSVELISGYLEDDFTVFAYKHER